MVRYIDGGFVVVHHRAQYEMRCFWVVLLASALAMLPCAARYSGHTEYRPVQDVCQQNDLHRASFSVKSTVEVLAGVTAAQTRMYCLPNTEFVPSTYQEERTLRLAATQYSLWAEVQDTAVAPATVNNTTPGMCEQQLKTALCPREYETPLFIVDLPKATFFECRCRDGFFRSTVLVDDSRDPPAAAAPCVACADGNFCPIHTNKQFECPPNSKLSVVSGASRDGVRRFLALTTPDAYCEATSGYVLKHVNPDINALLQEQRSLTSAKSQFYMTERCVEPSCYQRILCDVTGQLLVFAKQCVPGQFYGVPDQDIGGTNTNSSNPAMVLWAEKSCQTCPGDSYCMDDLRTACHPQQSTYGDGHSKQDACRCAAGSYKHPDNPELCVNISSSDFYSRACVSATDQTCGILLDCPPGHRCVNGFVVVQCKSGEYLDGISQECRPCPLGSYCVAGGVVQACPLGASTSHIGAVDAGECFCVAPLTRTRLVGTAQGFVCQVQAVRGPVGADFVGGRGVLVRDDLALSGGVRMTVNAMFSVVRAQHRPFADILGTVLVFDSDRVCVDVHLFVRLADQHKAGIVTSSLSILDTTASAVMQPRNTEMVLGWVDFGTAASSADTVAVVPVSIYVMFIDVPQGLVLRGHFETSMDHDKHELSMVTQVWTEMWKFASSTYYTVLAVPNFFSLVAFQASDADVLASRLVEIGQNTSAQQPFHDLIKLDLLSARVTTTQFQSNKSALLQLVRPSTLKLDPEQKYVAVCDPAGPADQFGTEFGMEVARVDLTDWQTSPNATAATTAATSSTTPCNAGITQQQTLQGAQLVFLTPTQRISYRDLFEESSSLLFFEDTDGHSFGIVGLEYASCAHGAWAHADSFFKCVCRPGYQPRVRAGLLPFRGGAYAANGDECVLCAMAQICSAGTVADANATKCAPGFRLNSGGGGCELCGPDEFCYNSRGNACPHNSHTLHKLGAVHVSDCVCSPGYYFEPATDNDDATATAAMHGICTECRRPSYCTESRVRTCRENTSTVVDMATDSGFCRCWPGFFEQTPVIANGLVAQDMQPTCNEAPLGSFTSPSGLVKCPAQHTTLHTQSTSVSQCVCDGGFKTVRTHSSSTAYQCVLCVMQEVCALGSGGVPARCDTTSRQVVNDRHDACVCEAGFYDEMATQEGAMQCVACPAGHYCPQEKRAKVQPALIRCPYQTTSHPGTPSISGCFCKQSDRNLMTGPVAPFALQCLCANTHYESMDNVCTACPANMFVSLQTMFSSAVVLPRVSACVCVSGFYRQQHEGNASHDGGSTCLTCPVGHFCPAGQNSNSPLPCPVGTFGPSLGQRSVRGCLTCPPAVVTLALSNQSNVSSDAQLSLQGTVVDCFLEFTPVFSSRELQFDVCSFVFVVFSKNIKSVAVSEAVMRVFQHKLLQSSLDAVSSLNQIQYSVTLTEEFFLDILSLVSHTYDIWSAIRSDSQDNPTLYASIVRYLFCDTMLRIADDLHPNSVDAAVCYLAMDRMTTVGKSLSLAHNVHPAEQENL